MDVIKVAGSSRTAAVAGAIAGVFREYRRVEVQAIGAGAVNQAVKALVLAASYLEKDNLRVAFMPQFSDIDIEGKVRTAIKFVVVPYEGAAATPPAAAGDTLPDAGG
jgi:stage V sporulation protein S